MKPLPGKFSKTIYPAEALSSVAVSNILAGLTKSHAGSKAIAKVRAHCAGKTSAGAFGSCFRP